MKHMFLVILCLCVLGSACSQRDVPEADIEVVDGISLVHNVATPLFPNRTVVFEEELGISPVDEEGNIIQERITEQRIVDRIDPGHIEYSGSLGTIPLSHKCVRNITSHAKFLHDWVVIGEASVVVID